MSFDHLISMGIQIDYYLQNASGSPGATNLLLTAQVL